MSDVRHLGRKKHSDSIKRWKADGASGLKMTSIGIDVAQGGADETVLAPLYGTWSGRATSARFAIRRPHVRRPGPEAAAKGAEEV